MKLKDLFYISYMRNRCEIVQKFSFEPFKREIKYFFRRKKDFGHWRNSDAINFKSISSFDEHIREKGGIVDNMGNVHSTALSYKNHLKDNNLVIRDWKEGTNKSSERQFKSCELSDIPNF